MPVASAGVAPWSADAIRRLRDDLACPVCGRRVVVEYVCQRCGADFRELRSELWDASLSAAAALEARQALLERVPRGAVGHAGVRAGAGRAGVASGVSSPGAGVGVSSSPSPEPRGSAEARSKTGGSALGSADPLASAAPAAAPASNATVQSVLAVAGAGLVAIAAVVFTFFNAELTDRGLRAAIVGATTVLFVLGARVLMRRGLRFSAESVGALGAVFLALDVVLLADAVPASPWTAAAIGTLVAAGGLGVLGLRGGIRIWLSAALVAGAFVPVMFAAGMPDAAAAWIGRALSYDGGLWAMETGRSVIVAAGWFASAVAAHALITLAQAVAARFDGRLRAERVTLTVVQLCAIGAAFLSSWFATDLTWSARMLLLAALFLTTSVLALFSARHPAGGLWSFVGGGSAVFGAVVLVVAIPGLNEWAPTLALAAAVGALIVVAALVPLPRGAARGLVTGGGVLAVALVACVPTMMSGLLVLITLLDRGETAPSALALATGLAALGVGLRGFVRLRARTDAVAGIRWLAHLGSWYVVLAALVLLCADSIPLGLRVAIGLLLAVALAFLARRVAPGAGAASVQQSQSAAPGAQGSQVGTVGQGGGRRFPADALAPAGHPSPVQQSQSAASGTQNPQFGTVEQGGGYPSPLQQSQSTARDAESPQVATVEQSGGSRSPAGPLAPGRHPSPAQPSQSAAPVAQDPQLGTVERGGGSRAAAWLPLIVGAHLLVLASGILSWRSDAIVVWAGAAVVAAVLLVGRALPSRARFVYVGAAYAYALVTFATALRLAGVEPLALVCLTTSFGALVAIAATFARAVPARSWLAILAVTTVPFAIGVLQVVVERSGWTALSTSLMFALALTLVVTRRPGLGVVVRALAAATLVPSLAVVAVCLGAQLLPMSGSPVVLPVVAALVALVLPTAGSLQAALAPRIGAAEARVARIAVEASTLLTAAIAVGLALTRDAAGLGTALLVLAILGAGGIATAVWGGRRYGWWLAGAAFTGALWCGWGLTGVTLREAYVLPPALGAALIGAVLTARGGRGIPLYGAGLLVAVVSTLVDVALAGSPVRTMALLAASWVLVAAGWWLLAARGRSIAPSAEPDSVAQASQREAVRSGGRDSDTVARPWSALARPTLAVAIVAGAAGAVQGVRLGLGMDAGAPGIPLVLLCLALGVTGAAPAALAAGALVGDRARLTVGSRPAGTLTSPFNSGKVRVLDAIRRTLARVNSGGWRARPGERARRWLFAPAFAYVGVAAWTAIDRDWPTIWIMWGLMLAYLVALLAIALRTRRATTTLPPVWFVFALAFTTAVVAWSPRDLRVEWFSLPLGAFLLAAGAVHLSARGPGARLLTSWPAGWRGSWALLTPGILVMLSASIAATFTDPLTWRAILVIGLALVAILVGATRRLAAPFVIGIVVLPVENALAFLVQIGRGIDAMPWWITLAVVGAVLLILAVTYERRAGEERGVVARLRDLA